MIPKPGYISQDAWDGFLEQKSDGLKRRGKKLTKLMIQSIIKQCDALKSAGHNVDECLIWSAIKGYDFVYEARFPEVTKQECSTSDDRIKAEREAAARESARVEAYIARTAIRRVV